MGSLTVTFSYAADLLPTQATGPNGDSTSTAYDTYARPISSLSKPGAVTYFTYVNSPPQTLSYTNPTGNAVGRVSRLTLDGFGRAIKQEAGMGTLSGGVITVSVRPTPAQLRPANQRVGASRVRSEILRWFMPGRTLSRYSFTGKPSLRQDSMTDMIAATLGPDFSLPTCSQFLRPKATGLIEFSARLLDNSTSAWSKHRCSFSH